MTLSPWPGAGRQSPLPWGSVTWSQLGIVDRLLIVPANGGARAYVFRFSPFSAAGNS